ncbi:MAG: hypothetical protein ACREML_11645, partial [Vulcanimicrobiaceae bacterium]
HLPRRRLGEKLMYYVELMFVRSRIYWYVGIILIIAAVFLYFVTFPPAGAHIHNGGQDIPLNALLIGASWFACIMASMISSTLNRDQSHLPYMWTKPVPRERIALSYIAIDVLTILFAYGFVLLVGAAVLAVPPRNHMLTDDLTIPFLLRTLAIPLMLYGIVEVATSWSQLRLGSAVGIYWGGAWTMLLLSGLHLPAPLGPLVTVVNLINPLAYFPEEHSHGVHIVTGGAAMHLIAMPFGVTTALAYCIFVASIAVAIYNWKRMEA